MAKAKKKKGVKLVVKKNPKKGSTKLKSPAKKAAKPEAREAFYRNVGYGLTSWEGPDAVVAVRKGRLFTQTFDGGMEPSGKDGEWKFDGGFGMVTYATLVKPAGFNPNL